MAVVSTPQQVKDAQDAVGALQAIIAFSKNPKLVDEIAKKLTEANTVAIARATEAQKAEETIAESSKLIRSMQDAQISLQAKTNQLNELLEKQTKQTASLELLKSESDEKLSEIRGKEITLMHKEQSLAAREEELKSLTASANLHETALQERERAVAEREEFLRKGLAIG